MTGFLAATWRMSAGVVVWILHFAAIYGLTALACARGARGLVPWIVAVPTIAAVAACLAILLRLNADRDDFQAWVGAGLTGFALVAIVWEALPVLVVAACA